MAASCPFGGNAPTPRSKLVTRCLCCLDRFPTHLHSASFWERLGRTVATFGFLEEILAKAILAFTGMRRYDEAGIQQAYEEWVPVLERTRSDPLGNLIDTYGQAVRNHPDSTIGYLDDLLAKLREAAAIRNVLCHGSWGAPTAQGASVP